MPQIRTLVKLDISLEQFVQLCSDDELHELAIEIFAERMRRAEDVHVDANENLPHHD